MCLHPALTMTHSAKTAVFRIATNSIHRLDINRPTYNILVLVRSYGHSSQQRASGPEKPSENLQNNSLVGRDFLSLHHFRRDELKQFLWTAIDLKTRMKENGEVFEPLRGKSAALMFCSSDTKTQLSFESGLGKLGGHATLLRSHDNHLGENEGISDNARVLAGMSDVIVAHGYPQRILDTIADKASIPVIAGLSSLLHPMQTLADFMTIQEHFGYLPGCKIAWVGDNNAVLQSLMLGCARMGIDLGVATPPGYEPDPDVLLDAMNIAGKTGASFQIGNNPLEAVYRADAIYTDVWISDGGKDAEMKKRMSDFQGYQVTRKMLKEAGGNWIFLHCLPRKQEEVMDDIFYGEESLVWQQAGNRMWTAMSVMLHLLQHYTPSTPMPKFVRG